MIRTIIFQEKVRRGVGLLVVGIHQNLMPGFIKSPGPLKLFRMVLVSWEDREIG